MDLPQSGIDTELWLCQLQYFSSVFARKWFPEEKSQLLLIDDADNKWPVTFIPTASHMVLGAGWAKFVRNNKLEKGDVVVFELKNPNTLTLVVHIFRVKDYTFLKVSDAGNTNSVSTPSRSETPTGTTMANTSVGIIKDESPTGITDFSGLKVPQTPMLPQYAAVAKYFANRGTPVVETRRKVGNGATGEAELQKSSEGMNRNGTASVVTFVNKYVCVCSLSFVPVSIYRLELT